MHSYKAKKNTGTYTVNKTLVQNIENYIIESIPGILMLTNENKEQFARCITIILHDTYGEEKFKNIEEYKFPNFRDDTKAVSIIVSLENEHAANAFELKLIFSRLERCTIYMSLTDETPIDKAIIIEKGLTSIMSYHKNVNLAISRLVMILSGIIIPVAFFIAVRSERLAPLIFSILSCCFFYYLRKYCKGYCSFDTNRQKRLDFGFNWFTMGLLGFILFATGFTLIRKMILGF